ncbi:glycine N-acyltransferase-like protein [Haliotis rubra]|uniref:glycine N-acyltransferase-like protein n=1 Tax=Haliotis rubra TaxID=36100 RepID=UPI001EE624E2|nr:glycine N-acyltransferase-like protein [Haliotis rubra]XP_046555932.1 glycine N-acyltransferase-like protein [Haliotis rubra]
MVLRLTRDKLVQVRQKLKTYPGTLKIVGEIDATLENHTGGYDFIVDRWPEFTAVVSQAKPEAMGYSESSVNLYATDKNALKSFLHSPDIFNWAQKKERFVFAAVHTRLVPVVTEVMDHFQIPCKVNIDVVYMTVTQRSLKLRPVPEGFTLTSVQTDQAPLINSLWKFSSGEASEAHIRLLISKRPSTCLYNEAGVLLGYALTYLYGCQGMLHVIKEHRGKGYGKVIMSQLALKNLQVKTEVSVIIESDNEPSLRLHENMGFEVVPNVTANWIACNY